MSDRTEGEWLTRKQRIDPKLRIAGWKLAKFDSSRSLDSYDRCAIEEYETANGPADYALCASGRILGIVEAKKVTRSPQGVLTQAERYSHGCESNPLNFDGFRVPFLYSTNGEIIWHHDIRHALNRSHTISGFHTPDALSEMLLRDLNRACDALQNQPNNHPRLRPYQIEANEAIEAEITNRKREMLVAMATGTGKTFMMANEIYRLMKSGVAKRVLFLVDRRALAAQAVRTFASFEAEPNLKFDNIYEVYSQRFHREDFDADERFDPKVLPTSYLTNPQPSHAFVYVCTIQRMTINLFGRESMFTAGDDENEEEDADRINIPIHAFDLIVADECHQGYTAAELSTWRQTLDHFDAIKIGLTATPASHTTSYFKEIPFRYTYERAVREGFLVDYDVVSIKSDVRMNGIFLSEGAQVGVVNPATGVEQLDMLEDERKFDAAEIEEKATAPESNKRILEEIRRYAHEHEELYGRFPKTLIFAVNDLPHTSHADQLVELARDVFGQGDAFVRKITGTVDRPLQRIREFRNRNMPGIVVTVDMLSTGVDIPDLEFIVFLRPVKSRILFEQMLGRGTRRGELHTDKSHFTVFDCFDGTLLEYFRQATSITEEPLQQESRTIIEIIEDIWNNRDREYNTRCLVKRLQRINKEMSGDAREMFAAYIPAGDMSSFAKELPQRLQRDFTGTMAILRDPNFQNLLLHYPRPPRVFIRAYDAEDTVFSSWLVRGADGREYKPEDYLEAFSRFVQENPDHIEGIRILLNSPKDWNTEALTELRTKLASSHLRFTEENLQRAHRIHYQKALVDIISMIKHAASKEKPLLTAEERVKFAIEKVTAGRSFTPEQMQWLGRIQNHLTENLSIDAADFDTVPVLSLHGGWNRANKDFHGHLSELIRAFNEAVAA
jgi:type I restriction enzyme R subunit